MSQHLQNDRPLKYHVDKLLLHISYVAVRFCRHYVCHWISTQPPKRITKKRLNSRLLATRFERAQQIASEGWGENAETLFEYLRQR